jgi:hypothetical protein
MFRSYDHLQVEIYTLEINILTSDHDHIACNMVMIRS